MKTNFAFGIVIATLLLLAWPVSGQIRVLTQDEIYGLLNQLDEVDFEDLPPESIDPDPDTMGPGLPNPLRLEGVKFTDPYGLDAGHCSSPTCEPDPDNAHGGNIALFLNPDSTISFNGRRSVVVLDLQGNGDDRITFVFTDKRGRQTRVEAQAILFGVTLVGVSAPAGVKEITIESGGASGGPLSLARVLFSKGR
jgi:hypothetical protein